MNTPEWTEEGEPANIEAALADALEWLDVLSRFQMFRNRANGAARERLGNCMEAANRYLPQEFRKEGKS